MPAQPVITSPQPINTPSVLGITPSGASASPSFSADGRYLAFVSYAKDIVPGQKNSRYNDVFVHDLVTGITRLVTLNTNGAGGANGDCSMPLLSSNGQYCAFLSVATDLVTAPRESVTNFGPNLYVRDLNSGTTTIESIGINGKIGVGYCSDFTMTPDGHYLAFVSTQVNLTTNSFFPVQNIFVRDHFAGTTELITARTNSQNSAYSSDFPCISDDGRRVLFHTGAPDIDGSPGGIEEIYLRDRATRSTLCIGTNASQLYSTNRPTYGGTLTPDGLTAVFVSHGYGNVFIYDVASTNTTVIPFSDTHLGPLTDISADSHRILYKVDTSLATGTAPPPTPYIPSIYVWDTLLQTNFVVDGTQTNNGLSSVSPVLSRDGTKVAFISNATNYNAGQYTWQLLVRDLDAGVTHLVTTRTNGDPLGAGSLVCSPTFSPDGKYLAFVCDDDALVPGDHNHAADIFLWSADTGQLQLITTNNNSVPVGNDISGTVLGSHTISTNARYLAFAAVDGNLIASDTNGFPDVFIRDLLTGQNILASTKPDGSLFTDPNDLSAAIQFNLSADAQYLAYTLHGNAYLRKMNTSTVTVLTDTNNQFAGAKSCAISSDNRFVAFDAVSNLQSTVNNIFLYDTASDTNRQITFPPAGSQYYSGYNSSNAVFTPDGKWLVYQSSPGYAGTTPTAQNGAQYFAWNIAAGTNTHISYTPAHALFDSACSNAVFSADGNVMAFNSTLGGARVLATHNFSNNLNQIVCYNGFFPSLNGDGTKVVYLATNSGKWEVYLQTIGSSQSNLVSLNYNGSSVANSNCANPILSPDGRFVIFTSTATNLVANDTNRYPDIFIRDLVLSNTITISSTLGGTPNIGANNPVLAADGRTIVFQSFSTDLTTNILTPTRSLFLTRIQVGDSDHDGMDDDWEMTYFGNLTHDGSADTDGDGLTDLQEFQAGTNPINNTSVLRCLAITSSTGGTTIYWSSIPGKNYRIEYKSNIDDPTWSTLIDSIAASTETMSMTDTNTTFSTQRFYRVTALP